jgi:mannosyltransferase OCH1-like enzyme
MIPKVIHYCWFGGNTKSELVIKCIESWKFYLPEFEIIEWNEVNSMKFKNKFYRDSLRKKKYAFVSDYIRTRVLYEYGGIYFDTDMILIDTIDSSLLEYDFFTAYEAPNRVSFGLFGSIKSQRFLKSMLEFYDLTQFDRFNPPVITSLFNSLINENSLSKNEIILSTDYFYSLPYEHRGENLKAFLTKNSIAVHLWSHSWKESNAKENMITYFNNIFEVSIDFLFYNYSKSYLNLYITLNYKFIVSFIKSKLRFLLFKIGIKL